MHTTRPANREPKHAQNMEEIKPLVELCKAGKLFEVQDWIRAGKPVNPPDSGRGTGPRSPLEVAIEQGFHSLIQVLLESGAAFERVGRSTAMSRALKHRRFDIVKLLVEHGYDPASVDMREVFETWDGELMDYFIDRGANVEDRKPLADALCNRIQTALRIVKRDRERFPSFQRQADIALRYHCKEGNMKWVSLMLWAGADPYASGAEIDDKDAERSHGITALELAALYKRYEIFGLKQIRLDPKHPAMQRVAYFACSSDGLELLKKLFELGVEVNDQDNGGSSLIGHLLDKMSWNFRGGLTSRLTPEGLDTSEAHEGIELIEFLAQKGAKWAPKDKGEINSARRSLLKLVPRYALGFFSIMATHKACSKGVIQTLLGTASMKKHMRKQAQLISQFISFFPEASPGPSERVGGQG
jgi:hypothetical protein